MNGWGYFISFTLAGYAALMCELFGTPTGDMIHMSEVNWLAFAAMLIGIAMGLKSGFDAGRASKVPTILGTPGKGKP